MPSSLPIVGSRESFARKSDFLTRLVIASISRCREIVRCPCKGILLDYQSHMVRSGATTRANHSLQIALRRFKFSSNAVFTDVALRRLIRQYEAA